MVTAGLFLTLALAGQADAVAPAPSAAAATFEIRNCLITAFKKQDVPAAEPGVLVELGQDLIGQEVKEGQKLAAVDSLDAIAKEKGARFELEVARAKADSDAEYMAAVKTLGVAKAELQSALDANRRVKGSVPENEIRRLQLTVERTEYEIKIRELERANFGREARIKEQQIEIVSNEIARRQIKSSIDGVVVELLKHRGEWVQPGETICKIVGLDEVRVVGLVPSRLYSPASIKGARVQLVVDFPLPNGQIAKETAEGSIEFVSPVVETSGDFRVWAHIKNRRDRATGEYVFRSGTIGRMTVMLNSGARLSQR